MSKALSTAALDGSAAPRGAHAVICDAHKPRDPVASRGVIRSDRAFTSNGPGDGILDQVFDVFVTGIAGLTGTTRLKDADQVGPHRGVVDTVGAGRHAPTLPRGALNA